MVELQAAGSGWGLSVRALTQPRPAELQLGGWLFLALPGNNEESKHLKSAFLGKAKKLQQNAA